MAQFLREICTRAQSSTVYTAGQRPEFFLINVRPSGMDVLRAAADTIERAPADRGAEVAALEQRATDLSVQLARAFVLIAGAASTLEDIARGQPPRHLPDGGIMVASTAASASSAPPTAMTARPTAGGRSYGYRTESTPHGRRLLLAAGGSAESLGGVAGRAIRPSDCAGSDWPEGHFSGARRLASRWVGCCSVTSR